MSITTPSTFRVIAIISTYNEEDIIVQVIKHLIKEGISVYIIDNWSTDRTWELLNELSPSLIGLERFPKDGPSPTYDWEDILKRKQALCKLLVADWFMHHDADEIRESPWPGIRLKDAIYIVDQHGYNAINFELLNFHPVDNNFQPGSDPCEHFNYFQFNDYIGNELQVKAWKRTKAEIDILVYGGHIPEFPDRNIFPYKFIIRHFPIRSQEHGEKKVFLDRKKRFNRSEKEKGWHTQYDKTSRNNNFIKDPSSLIKFQSGIYYELFINQLFEREELNQKLSADLAARDQTLQQLNTDLAARDQTLQQLNTDLAARDQTLQQLNTDLATRDQTLQQLSIVLAEREQEVLFYALSKSWRITRPLRILMKKIKGR